MNPINLKIALPISIFVAGLVPSGLYHASNFYVRKYNQSTNYLSEFKNKTLNKVGLTTVQPESSYDDMINSASAKYKLNPNLIKAMMLQESGKNPDAYSIKNCIGLMQILPANFKRCGLKSASKLWDEKSNIMCGAQIISEEVVTYKGDIYTALRGYNGSPAAVKSNNPDTHKYASQVLAKFAKLTLTNQT